MNLIQELEQSIYRINTASGSGTGFYNAEYDLVITNYHVVEGSLQVSIENGKKDRFLANVVYINPMKDIAFLKVEGMEKPGAFIKTSHNHQCSARDEVLVLGFPYGMPFTVTEGIVSNPKQQVGDGTYIQTDAAVNPGNSGGPIIDKEGNLAGIVTSKFNDADNVGFAIPLEVLQEELELADEISLDSISVGCPSCNGLIEEKTNYCPNCGADVAESYFDAKPLSDLAILLENAIQQMEVNPVLARAGIEYWNFHKGSANIRLFIHGNSYLCATSPLNKLPRKNLADLYEYLLSEDTTPYRLSISDNQIFISYIVHISDLYSSHQERILSEIAGMAQKADDLDDLFVENFGAPMTHYSKSE